MIQYQLRNKYAENAAHTATPAQLLLMLYDGAIRFCKSGIDALRKKNNEQAHHAFCKVQDIVVEFMTTLDKKAPVSESLLLMYEYMHHRLVEANVKKDVAAAEEVLGYLVELKETWAQAAKSAVAGAK